MSTPVSSALDTLPKDIWMLRPCKLYNDEYTECNSFAGRFQQHYVYGKSLDCEQWKENYTNCLKFRNTQDAEILAKVLEHERERRRTRLADARGNDVWEYRHHPPEDWNTVLGVKKNDDTLLAKVQEARQTQSKTEQQTRCVIS